MGCFCRGGRHPPLLPPLRPPLPLPPRGDLTCVVDRFRLLLMAAAVAVVQSNDTAVHNVAERTEDLAQRSVGGRWKGAGSSAPDS